MKRCVTQVSPQVSPTDEFNERVEALCDAAILRSRNSGETIELVLEYHSEVISARLYLKDQADPDRCYDALGVFGSEDPWWCVTLRKYAPVSKMEDFEG